MSESSFDNGALDTYRLVLAVVVLAVAFLAAAILIEMWRAGRCSPQDSISAYYYSPVGPVFVGSLVAIGVCLVVLEGHSLWEDWSLNLAGFMAPIVALVPKKGAGDCRSIDTFPDPLAPSVDGGVLGVADWVEATVRNSVLSYIIVVAAGSAAMWVYAMRRSGAGQEYARGTVKRKRLDAAIGSGFAVSAIAAFLSMTWDGNETRAHLGAAGLMFGFLMIAAFDNGVRRRGRIGVLYWWIGALMAVTGTGLWWLPITDKVLWVEVVEIALFTFFWIAQTKERWHESGRFGGQDAAVGIRDHLDRLRFRAAA